MTLPSRLEIAKEFADPARELGRVPTGQAVDWVVIRERHVRGG
jgi:hypothetical protein